MTKVVPLLLNAKPFPGAKDLTSAGTDGQRICDTGSECRDAQVQETIVPVRFEFGLRVTFVDFRRKLTQLSAV